jgi:hypothetical protein
MRITAIVLLPTRTILADLEEIAVEKELSHIACALKQALPVSLSEAQVIDEAIKYLAAHLPEDEEGDEDSTNFHAAGMHRRALLRSRTRRSAFFSSLTSGIASGRPATWLKAQEPTQWLYATTRRFGTKCPRRFGRGECQSKNGRP